LPNKVSIGCDISCGTQAAANAVKAICAHHGSGSKSDYIAYSVECRLTQVSGDLDAVEGLLEWGRCTVQNEKYRKAELWNVNHVGEVYDPAFLDTLAEFIANS